MNTVGELKNWLKETGMSPERLAKRVGFSNMTIRRLLKEPATAEIPEKYRSALVAIRLGGETEGDAPAGGFDFLLDQLYRDGDDFERSHTSSEALKSDVETKLKTAPVGQEFKNALATVMRGSFGKLPGLTRSQRILCIGALLYFLNPFDLIPDTLGPIGYVDDFGVLSLAVASIVRSQQKNAAETGGEREQRS